MRYNKTCCFDFTIDIRIEMNRILSTLVRRSTKNVLNFPSKNVEILKKNFSVYRTVCFDKAVAATPKRLKPGLIKYLKFNILLIFFFKVSRFFLLVSCFVFFTKNI
jgi:hypothetical protein